VPIRGARRRAALLGFSLLIALGLCAARSAGGGVTAAVPHGTIVFASDRSGNSEIYSVRADGSHLGQLTRNRLLDTMPLFSPDGRRILFLRGLDSYTPELWVMNADGSGQRKLASRGSQPAWAPDSRRIAYRGSGFPNSTLVITGVGGGGRHVIPGEDSDPAWSPDGTAIAFFRTVSGGRSDLMVVGSDGRRLKMIRRDIVQTLGWSPSSPHGEITFLTYGGLYAVGPDGRGARRLAGDAGQGFMWSPDGRRFAFAGADGRLRVASAAGGGARDLTPKGAGRLDAPAWSPDGRWIVARRLLAGARFHDLLVVAADGSSSRQITDRVPRPDGSENQTPTWRPRGATPARLGAAPVAPLPSAVATATTFRPDRSGSIEELAADGGRAAVIVEFDHGCAGVQVWEPARHRAVQLQHPCGPNSDVSNLEATRGIALAGTRAAWLHLGGSNSLETDVLTATLAHPTSITLADEVSNSGDGVGNAASQPYGHRGLLAFTVDRRCDGDGTINGRPDDQCPAGGATGDVVAATVWRVGGQGSCPARASSPRCTKVIQADGPRTVLAVDTGRIVLKTESGISLITAHGGLIRKFPVEATAAALSGKRLALESTVGIEIYDTDSGDRTARFPAAQLEDLEGDILVTSRNAITLRRLGNGRTTTIHTRGPAHAQLEPPGLFVATTHTVTFTPMKDLARRLAG